MEIRKAKLSDNLLEIAELIYETDNYIYPYWFKKNDKKFETLVELIKTKGSMFYYKNIIVAVEDKDVMGIMVAIDSDTDLSYDYSKIMTDKYSKYAIKNYIIPTIQDVKNDYVDITNVCIEKAHRRKLIATHLFEFLFKLYGNKKNFELVVLKNNPPAVNLYTKEGFSVVSEQNGFNAPFKRKPRTYTMHKIVK